MTVIDCPTEQVCIDGMCRPSAAMDASLVDGATGPDSTTPGFDVGADAGPEDAGLIEQGTCRLDPIPDPFMNPRLELHWRGAGLPFPTSEHAVQSPIVIDFIPEPPDTTSIPEILFLTYPNFDGPSGVIRVISGREPYTTHLTIPGDGMGAATADTGRAARFRADTHLAAADLDGNGTIEVVGVLLAGGAVAARNDGSELWTAPATALPQAETIHNASVAIADLEQDGMPEVIVGRVVLNGQTGAQKWRGTGSRGANGQGPLSCVADIVPSSPGLEVIAGQTAYSATGAILWGGMGEGFCAIADVVDATGASARDGMPEVMLVQSGTLLVLDGATGAERWRIQLPVCGGERGLGGAPTVADFDGDGLSEIGVAGALCYAVFDPQCVAGGAGCAAAGILWQIRTHDSSSNVTSSTVFDFNGDGRAEVVYNDEDYFLVLEGATGTVLFMEPNPSRTRTEQPIVADVDNDGNAEIVFTANREHEIAGALIPAAERLPGLEIWSSADDRWVGARQVWNQHAYHIDNIEASGAVPRTEAASWLTHNTYRLQNAADNALNAPDLVGQAVPSGLCEAGTLELCIELRNRGDIRVGPGITVTFYAGDPAAGGTAIGSATSTENLDRADVQTLCVDWTGASDTPTRIYAEVDSEDVERECVEDNNIVDLGDRSCSVIM